MEAKLDSVFLDGKKVVANLPRFGRSLIPLKSFNSRLSVGKQRGSSFNDGAVKIKPKVFERMYRKGISYVEVTRGV